MNILQILLGSVLISCVTNVMCGERLGLSCDGMESYINYQEDACFGFENIILSREELDHLDLISSLDALSSSVDTTVLLLVSSDKLVHHESPQRVPDGSCKRSAALIAMAKIACMKDGDGNEMTGEGGHARRQKSAFHKKRKPVNKDAISKKTSKYPRKRIRNCGEPELKNFTTERDFQIAWEVWREMRDRNNAAVRKSRSQIRS